MKEALLLIDFVNDIVHEKGKVAKFGTPAHVVKQHAIANTKAVLDDARKKGIKVIFIRVCFAPGYPELANTKAPFYLAQKENNWLVKDTWGTEFHEELQPIDDEIVLEKHRINPFTNPQLEKELTGIGKIIVTGVSTNLAIEETVRTAAAKDFSVVVLEDCCAGNNQEMHDFSVKHILPKFAQVISSKNFIAE